MDSGGFGTLRSAYKIARAKNGRIDIINVGKNINNLIGQSRFTERKTLRYQFWQAVSVFGR